MHKPTKSPTRDLRSASDFEQWLNEIKLFAHETQTELHEISGLLNVALANEPGLDLRSADPRERRGEFDLAASRPIEQSQPGDSTSDEQLATLQQKLANQLKSKQRPTSATPTDTAGAEPRSPFADDAGGSQFPHRSKDELSF